VCVVYVCEIETVCVCVCQRERERERETVYVFVCVCERERLACRACGARGAIAADIPSLGLRIYCLGFGMKGSELMVSG
jgi:hypothetical protein